MASLAVIYGGTLIVGSLAAMGAALAGKKLESEEPPPEPVIPAPEPEPEPEAVATVVAPPPLENELVGGAECQAPIEPEMKGGAIGQPPWGTLDTTAIGKIDSAIAAALPITNTRQGERELRIATQAFNTAGLELYNLKEREKELRKEYIVSRTKYAEAVATFSKATNDKQFQQNKLTKNNNSQGEQIERQRIMAEKGWTKKNKDQRELERLLNIWRSKHPVQQVSPDLDDATEAKITEEIRKLDISIIIAEETKKDADYEKGKIQTKLDGILKLIDEKEKEVRELGTARNKVLNTLANLGRTSKAVAPPPDFAQRLKRVVDATEANDLAEENLKIFYSEVYNLSDDKTSYEPELTRLSNQAKLTNIELRSAQNALTQPVKTMSSISSTDFVRLATTLSEGEQNTNKFLKDNKLDTLEDNTIQSIANKYYELQGMSNNDVLRRLNEFNTFFDKVKAGKSVDQDSLYYFRWRGPLKAEIMSDFLTSLMKYSETLGVDPKKDAINAFLNDQRTKIKAASETIKRVLEQTPVTTREAREQLVKLKTRFTDLVYTPMMTSTTEIENKKSCSELLGDQIFGILRTGKFNGTDIITLLKSPDTRQEFLDAIEFEYVNEILITGKTLAQIRTSCSLDLSLGTPRTEIDTINKVLNEIEKVMTPIKKEYSASDFYARLEVENNIILGRDRGISKGKLDMFPGTYFSNWDIIETSQNNPSNIIEALSDAIIPGFRSIPGDSKHTYKGILQPSREVYSKLIRKSLAKLELFKDYKALLEDETKNLSETKEFLIALSNSLQKNILIFRNPINKKEYESPYIDSSYTSRQIGKDWILLYQGPNNQYYSIRTGVADPAPAPADGADGAAPGDGAADGAVAAPGDGAPADHADGAVADVAVAPPGDGPAPPVLSSPRGVARPPRTWLGYFDSLAPLSGNDLALLKADELRSSERAPGILPPPPRPRPVEAPQPVGVKQPPEVGKDAICTISGNASKPFIVSKIDGGIVYENLPGGGTMQYNIDDCELYVAPQKPPSFLERITGAFAPAPAAPAPAAASLRPVDAGIDLNPFSQAAAPPPAAPAPAPAPAAPAPLASPRAPAPIPFEDRINPFSASTDLPEASDESELRGSDLINCNATLKAALAGRKIRDLSDDDLELIKQSLRERYNFSEDHINQCIDFQYNNSRYELSEETKNKGFKPAITFPEEGDKKGEYVQIPLNKHAIERIGKQQIVVGGNKQTKLQFANTLYVSSGIPSNISGRVTPYLLKYFPENPAPDYDLLLKQAQQSNCLRSYIAQIVNNYNQFIEGGIPADQIPPILVVRIATLLGLPLSKSSNQDLFVVNPKDEIVAFYEGKDFPEIRNVICELDAMRMNYHQNKKFVETLPKEIQEGRAKSIFNAINTQYAAYKGYYAAELDDLRTRYPSAEASAIESIQKSARDELQVKATREREEPEAAPVERVPPPQPGPGLAPPAIKALTKEDCGNYLNSRITDYERANGVAEERVAGLAAQSEGRFLEGNIRYCLGQLGIPIIQVPEAAPGPRPPPPAAPAAQVLDEEDNQRIIDRLRRPDIAIAGFYNGPLQKENVQVEEAYPDRFGIPGWKVIHTVGDGNCLTHAFLQSLSQRYRRLPTNEIKEQVGVQFRLEFAKTTLARNKVRYRASAVGRNVPGTADLTDTEIKDYCELFQIIAVMKSSGDGTLTSIVPDAYNIQDPAPGTKIIFIYGGNGHYSSVQTNTNTMTLTYEQARAIPVLRDQLQTLAELQAMLEREQAAAAEEDAQIQAALAASEAQGGRHIRHTRRNIKRLKR